MRTRSRTLPPSSLWTGKPAAFPARSQSAISTALTALPHGLTAPRWRILTEQRISEQQNMRLQVGFVRFNLAISADALIGDQPHNRVRSNDRAFDVSDLHNR